MKSIYISSSRASSETERISNCTDVQSAAALHDRGEIRKLLETSWSDVFVSFHLLRFLLLPLCFGICLSVVVTQLPAVLVILIHSSCTTSSSALPVPGPIVRLVLTQRYVSSICSRASASYCSQGLKLQPCVVLHFCVLCVLAGVQSDLFRDLGHQLPPLPRHTLKVCGLL